MTTVHPADSSAQPRFRDRLSDLDRRALFAIVAEANEKSTAQDAAGVCRVVTHELAARRDAARASDDEPTAIRWMAIVNHTIEDTTGFRSYVESVLHWATMTPDEKLTASQPTPAQMDYLSKLGHTGLVKDRREASAIIDRLRRQREEGDR